MVKVEIKAEGLGRALSFMQDAAYNRGIKLMPLMRRAGEILVASTTKNFEEEGRPKWRKWSPLTREVYAGQVRDKVEGRYKREATKIKYYHIGMAGIASQKILSRDGHLKKSIHIGRVTDNSVEIGSSLGYARIHQLGGVIRPKRKKTLAIPLGGGKFLLARKVTIPARPYLALQEEDKMAVMRMVKLYLTEGR